MSELLPGFEPSEKDLVNRALAQPLEDKIKRSIGLLQMYEAGALKLSPNGYYLAFSGGKDSCVIKQLAIEAGVKFKAFYNLTTIDPPELVRFIKKHHADVTWSGIEKGNLPNNVVKFQTMPQRRFRWCCVEYKEHGGDGCGKIIGVRISESARRSKMWREFNPDKNSGIGAFFMAPIAYWTDADVWEFIRSRNLPYCELYDQGFKRLGCIGCPLAGQKDRDFQFKRFPKYEAMWKRAAFKLFDWAQNNPVARTGLERSIIRNFGTAENLWDWWRTGKAMEGDDSCVYEEMMMNT